MTHLLNNIVANFDWASVAYFVATFVEAYLVLTVLLLIFDMDASSNQKFLCAFFMVIIGKITSTLLPQPFSLILNYCSLAILITLIFKINILKSLTTLTLTVFIFGLVNTLIQKPYLTILDISLDTFMDTPKYRITYLIISYSFFGLFILVFKRFNNIKLKINTLDSLDNKTVIILATNLLLGVFLLFMQFVITAYYIDIVSVYINLLNLLLLIAFLILSTHCFIHVLELTITRKDLAYAEECNKSLKILYDKVKGFKHDFDSIVSSLNGYIEQNDMNGLKQYFSEVKKDCKIADDLALINPRTINNPGIYSLLNNEYAKASALGINFELEFFLNLNELEINIYFFSRILGVLLDNAIEAAENSKEKFVKISFIRENVNGRAVITIENSYSNKNIDLENIFKKGITSKECHAGLGLWEVKRYVNKSKNLDLKPSVSPSTFKQEFFIYDL
ncbi:histidine kinase [Clostridium sp. CAG:356]|nr:histidine kinase [Clostridium sp. CAG:356]